MKLDFIKRDIKNIREYGRNNAPLSAQKIWILPPQILYMSTSDRGGRKLTGSVFDGDWDQHKITLDELPKFQVCKKHFVDGMSWEQAGAYDLMHSLMESGKKVDGCINFNQVVQRYQKLDELYENLKKTRAFKSQSEIHFLNFREKGGVYVHIDRDGNALFGGGGFHRLAIARLLKLPFIPAQLGIVHRKAVDSRVWLDYTHPPKLNEVTRGR